MTLDQWLTLATRGLAQESVERVRAEIQQHCESAIENGDDAVAALGDPRVANRAYRKVLLTQQEEALAPALINPPKPTLTRVLLGLPILVAFLWWQASPILIAILIAILITAPLNWLWPPNTKARNRVYSYIYAVRVMVAAALAWWYQGWFSGFLVGVLLAFGIEYWFNRQRGSIFRKLESGQNFRPFPGEPELTHNEAIFLNTLRNGEPYQAVSIAFTSVMIAAMTWWLPATFAPLFVWWATIFATVCSLSIPRSIAAGIAPPSGPRW